MRQGPKPNPTPDQLRSDALRVMFEALLEISLMDAVSADARALRAVAAGALIRITEPG